MLRRAGVASRYLVLRLEMLQTAQRPDHNVDQVCREYVELLRVVHRYNTAISGYT